MKSAMLGAGLLVGAALLLASASAYADPPTVDWVVRYTGLGNGNNQVTDMGLDAQGCAYVTGYSSGLGWDIAVVKYSPGGRQLHAARYNGPSGGDDVPYGIAVGRHGEIYVCGYTDGNGQANYDLVTIKYDSTLVQQWVRTYAGQGNLGLDEAYAVAADSSGNVVVTGFSFESATGNDFVTLKYDPAGVRQWAARYDGIGHFDDGANAIALDDGGNPVVAGVASRNPVGGNYDIAVLRYSAAGVQQWVQLYNGTANGNDGAIALAVDSARNVYVGGYSTSTGNHFDMATLKYTGAGQLLWARIFDANHANDSVLDLALDGDANVCVTGFATFSGTQSDYATLKYDAAGTLQWARSYAGPAGGFDEGQSVAVDRTGNVVVTGYSDGGSGAVDYDYATVKYDPAGTQQWAVRYQGTGGNIDVAVKVLLDPVEDLIVSGWSTGTHGTDVDFTTIKYRQGGAGAVQPPAPAGLAAAGPSCTAGPNPFFDSATLRLRVPAAGPVDLTVWDASGRKVRTVVHGWMEPGVHQVLLPGSGLPVGVLVYRLATMQGTATGKLVRR